MKIEKINENQIRCTLTREDLEEHQVRISELAYGTEKAKRLFRDMMEQAQMQFGFEADNIPLMIEAIPINMESIILIITKVEDPEELDTRFSRFSPYHDRQTEQIQFDGADNIIDIFQKLVEAKLKSTSSSAEKALPEKETRTSDTEESAPAVNLLRLFLFETLDDVIAASRGLNHFFHGENELYKDKLTETYQLVMHQSDCSPEDFNKVCNILSEYGRSRSLTASGEAYLREHGEKITARAIQSLYELA